MANRIDLIFMLNSFVCVWLWKKDASRFKKFPGRLLPPNLALIWGKAGKGVEVTVLYFILFIGTLGQMF